MHNIKRREWGPNTLDEIVRYVDDKAYRIWLPGRVMPVRLAIPPTAVDVNNHSLYAFPKASGTGVRIVIARPLTWLSGTIRTIMHYSADTAGNTFAIVPKLETYSIGANMAAPNAVSANTDAVPGPSGINIISTYNHNQSLAINQADDEIIVQISRNVLHASDTNAGEFYLIGAWLVYTEGKKQIGLKTP